MNLFSQTDNTQRILTHKGRNLNYNQDKCQENFQDSAETAIFAPRILKIAFTVDRRSRIDNGRVPE